jgi:hypothetical protein
MVKLGASKGVILQKIEEQGNENGLVNKYK